jgi:hypothetical protein
LELMIFLGISFLPILRRCPSYWNLAAVIVLIRSGEASTVLIVPYSLFFFLHWTI